MIDVLELTIAEAGRAFRSGRFDPLTLTETYLQRIQAFDPSLNSYITVTADSALNAAHIATEEFSCGIDRGPLHGIPIAYKDAFLTANVRTTCGSPIHSDRVPEHDATVVRNIAGAGGVCLGKHNMHEFAFGGVHPDFGPVSNPWDPDREPGGSSSGSAAAVAAGLCLGSLGTDAGGSIRIPAGWCGVVGMKPTYGLVSRAGVDPLSWSLDHVGPIGRTVDDVALILAEISGYDAHDPNSAPRPGFAYDEMHSVDPSGLRIGVPWDILDRNLDVEVDRLFRAAIDQLAGLGLDVDVVRIEAFERLSWARMIITFSEAAAFHQPWLRTCPEKYSIAVLSRLASGTAIPAIHYINAQRTRRAMNESFARIHEHFDLLALPVSRDLPSITDTAAKPIQGDYVEDFHRRVELTDAFNVTGAPAISVPCGMSDSNLPVGLQLVGRPFEDHIVLAAARAFEKARGVKPSLPASYA